MSQPHDAPPPYSPHPAPLGFAGPPPGDGKFGAGHPPPGYGAVPSRTVHTQPQGSVQVVTTQPQQIVVTQPVVVVAGTTCPACRAGFLQNEFTCCGIFLGICCFPLGLICCFLMQERRCTNCHTTYGSAA